MDERPIKKVDPSESALPAGQRITKTFFHSVAGLLLFVALAKFFSAFGSARILEYSDPLLGFKNRQVLVFVGFVECFILGYVLLGSSLRSKCLLLLWLSSSFVLYRLGIWLMLSVKPCPCLGTLTERLAVKPSTIDSVLKLIIAYIFIGSACCLISDWLRGKQSAHIEVTEPTLSS